MSMTATICRWEVGYLDPTGQPHPLIQPSYHLTRGGAMWRRRRLQAGYDGVQYIIIDRQRRP